MRSAAFLALVTAALVLSCAAPTQEGGVVVAPGAAQRLMLAMRYGYSAAGVPPPADVRRVAYPEQLPGGPARTGRVGDWVLENGVVTAVVGAIDGSPRSGLLIDLAGTTLGQDELEALETRVLGERVRYTVLETGDDPTLGSAYVAVGGWIDRSAAGGPLLFVETRYDLGPTFDTIVISTKLVVERAAPALVPAPEPLRLVTDRLIVRPPRSIHTDPRGPQLAALARSGGYVLQPLDDVQTHEDLPGFSLADPGLSAQGDFLLYLRALVWLDRPDTAASAVALARILGEPLGEIDVRLVPTRGSGRRGDLRLSQSGGPALVARGVLPCGAESRYRILAPAGRYDVSFQNGHHTSQRAVPVEVTSRRLVTVDLPTTEARAPYDPPPTSARCPDEPFDDF